MNSAVVLFLKSVDLANDLVQSGVVINGRAYELSRYGKVVSPIRKIPLGCKNPLIRHLVSFRRLVFMVLKDGEDLDLVLKFRVDGFEQWRKKGVCSHSTNQAPIHSVPYPPVICSQTQALENAPHRERGKACASTCRVFRMEGQKKKLSGAQNRKRKREREKDVVGMKKSFSKWLKDSRLVSLYALFTYVTFVYQNETVGCEDGEKEQKKTEESGQTGEGNSAEEQRSPDDEEKVEQRGADEGEEQRSPDDEEEVEQRGADEGEEQRSPDDEEEVEQRASSNRECLTFFGTLQRLYTIFSSSVKRWDILTEFVDITLKPLSDTCWEAKLDSVKAVRFQLGGILDALQKLEEVAGDSKIVSEAKSHELVSMEFLVCLIVWHDLLLEINFASKALQAADVSMDTAIRLIESLKEFLLKYREEGFQKSLDIACRIASEMDASPEFKQRCFRKQKRFPDDNSCTGHHEKEPKRYFKCMVFNIIVDTILQELSERFSNLQLVSEKFKFITKMEHMTKAELEESVTRYALTTCDVSRDIIQEIYPASRLLKGYNALEKLNFLIKENLDLVFPNLTVALRVFLTMPLTVASAERSFSKLKLIKTYLRSSMNNDRLTQLAVISIENNVAQSISFDSILDKWASAKARKVTI
ncbi:hypothetical protein SRHO_G00343720 [Serrasalmus rhombeus]